MTVQQILDASRNNLNAISDTLWSDSELLITLYRVMVKAAEKSQCINTSESQNTIAGTATYTAPASFSEIWRITYEGTKLQPIDRTKLDSMNPNGVTSSGNPAYYLLEGTTITLYPTPSAVGALKVFFYGIPTAVPTTGTTLEIPARYHPHLVTLLTAEMCPKDIGHPMTLLWEGKAKADLADMQAHERKIRRSDRLAVVKLEEACVSGEFGIV